MLNLMIGLNGYTLCSGIICEELNGNDFAAVPFRDDEENQNSTMEIGYIVRKNAILSKMGERYVRALENYLESGVNEDRRLPSEDPGEVEKGMGENKGEGGIRHE